MEFVSFVEDVISKEVLCRIITKIKNEENIDVKFYNSVPTIKRGFGNIKKDISKYIDMSNNEINVLILTDLDSDKGACPKNLIMDWCKCKPDSLPKRLIFRVAKYEIETWLLADRENFASFLQIPKDNFEDNVEQILNPKEHILDVIRNKGQKKWHKEMLPKTDHVGIGPLYNSKLCEFVKDYWNISEAMKHSDSLNRAVCRIREFISNEAKV